MHAIGRVPKRAPAGAPVHYERHRPEQTTLAAAGQVVLKLKTTWRDGTTHLVMSPLEFTQRLASLVSRPSLHLIQFHGVQAPNAKWRALVVPQEAEAPAQAAAPAECEASRAHHRPVRLIWAKLLERVAEIDREHCPNCGGELEVIAAILEAPVIEKMLAHLGLQARAPSGACSWPGASSCLTSPNPNRSGDQATRAAGSVVRVLRNPWWHPPPDHPAPGLRGCLVDSARGHPY